MNYLKKSIFFLLPLLLFCYCGQPELDIPDYSPEIAVDGYIEEGRPPVMYLTYSSAFISEYDSMDFVNMVKFNVSAYVITEEKDTIGFTRQIDTDEFPPFKYTMSPSDLIGEVGKTYKLLIRKSGEDDITASTTIPLYSPEVFDICFELSEGAVTLGHYLFSMNNSDVSPYFFIQNKKNEEEDYYPVRFPAKSGNLYDGDTINLYVYRAEKSNIWAAQDDDDNDDDNDDDTSTSILQLYSINDTVTFRISSINEESYDVLSSLFIDAEFPDNPFRPISQLPESNVSNGIGRWTGMNSVTVVGRKP